jgi:hypothetical protein
METTREMIKSHPREPMFDSEKLTKAIGEMYICAQACTACADACLGEEKVTQLVDCIRLDLDCADICYTTGAILSRLTETSKELLQPLLQTCRTICNLCAKECEKHAEMHKHCKICAEACRRCEQACQL